MRSHSIFLWLRSGSGQNGVAPGGSGSGYTISYIQVWGGLKTKISRGAVISTPFLPQIKISQVQIKINQNQIKISQDQIKMSQDQIKISQLQIKISHNQIKISQIKIKISQNQIKVSQIQIKIFHVSLHGFVNIHLFLTWESLICIGSITTQSICETLTSLDY